MLRIENLNISYGNHKIIENATLEFNPGITCIIGESGSGKTTILKALYHQIDYQASKLIFNNIDILNENNSFFKQNFSYLTQDYNFISDISCLDNIKMFCGIVGVQPTDNQIYSYLKKVDLEWIDKNTYPDQLSGGEKQRLAIAQALAKNSPVIICDEITSALDYENKFIVFNLLNELSVHDNKTVILTSHDEDIYLLANQIYMIDDGQVIVKKSSLNEDASSKVIEPKKNHVPFKLLNSYILSKLDRQKFFSTIYSMITAIVVSLCAFLSFFTITSLSEQNTILNRLCENQIMIVNQTTTNLGSFSYNFDVGNLPFDSDVVEEIEKVEQLETLYPYYWISLVEPSEEKYTTMEIEINYDDKDSKIINEDIWAYEYCLIPYYSEQNFETKMNIINDANLNQGIYLNHIFLQRTGLTEDDLIGASLKFTVYPAVAYTTREVGVEVVETKETFTQTMQFPIGSPYEVELPIIGFVDFWYNEEIANAIIYCPIETMEQIRTKAGQNYLLNENEYIWKNNAYIGFVNEVDQLEAANIALRNINPQISTGNKYTDNAARYKQRRYIEITATISMLIVLSAGAVLSYVYGTYYYQQLQNDIDYFKRNGFSKNDFYKLISIDSIYQVLMNLIFALPFTFFISYFGQSLLNMFRFGIFSIQSIYILGLLMIFMIIQTIISRLHYYFNI